MKTIKSILTLIIASTLLLNCGGDKKKDKEGFSYENKTSKDKPNEDPKIAHIVLTGDDLMKFDKTEIKAKTGQKVKLTLRHKGKLEVNIMGHNVVILKQGVNVATFAGKAATARDSQYIPTDAKDDIIAHTNLIGGGQTTSIEFDAPATGTYDFICSFPGHYALMKGKFIVE